MPCDAGRAGFSDLSDLRPQAAGWHVDSVEHGQSTLPARENAEPARRADHSCLMAVVRIGKSPFATWPARSCRYIGELISVRHDVPYDRPIS